MSGRGFWNWLAALIVVASAMMMAPAEAQAQRRNQREAISLAKQAREAFGDEDFERAAELLEQAYGLYPEPNFIWNTARAYELAGLDDLAESYYGRFSQLDIPEEERNNALDKMARLAASRELPGRIRGLQADAETASLRRQNDRLRATLADVSTSAPTSTGPELSMMAIGGWTAAGLGVISLGAVATLHLASIGTVERYNEAAEQGEAARYDALQDTLNTRVVTSRVLLGTGLGLLAAGGTMLYLEYFTGGQEAGNDDSEALRLEPAIGPEGAGVFLHGRF